MALKNSALSREVVPTCKLARIWDSLDGDDQKTLTQWIDRGIGTRKIARELTADKHPIAQGAVTDHLDASCCCSDATDDLYGRRPRGSM